MTETIKPSITDWVDRRHGIFLCFSQTLSQITDTMKTILVATDFSENANQAADYACRFAGQLRSGVQLIHASSVNTDSPLEVIWPIEDQDRIVSRNEALLETFSAKLHDSVAASGGPDGF